MFFKISNLISAVLFLTFVSLQGAEVTFPYSAEVNHLIPVHPDPWGRTSEVIRCC